MDFPERFSKLPEYAFPRLRALLDAHAPGGDVIAMTIGEPRHPMPDFLGEVLARHQHEFAKYPPNEGTPGLLAAIAGWIERRHGARLDPASQVMVLNGSREGIVNASLALCPEQKNGQRPAVLMPNPFYQAYAIGALAAGAEPVYVPATGATGHLPDYRSLPPELLDRTAILWVCSPANPQGSIADDTYWQDLFALAERHDFRIFSDECYSEIWREAPPPGGLEMAARHGGIDPERLVVFNSLSKRSNLPGLRSGFVAGGAEALAHIKRLRAYGGAPLPLPIQHVSEAAWNDEAHVAASRALYAEKYRLADTLLGDLPGYRSPKAGFFLWLPVDDGEAAALKLWRETGVRVLPGAYLARDTEQGNPGKGFIRVAMVAAPEELQSGLTQIRHCLYD